MEIGCGSLQRCCQNETQQDYVLDPDSTDGKAEALIKQISVHLCFGLAICAIPGIAQRQQHHRKVVILSGHFSTSATNPENASIIATFISTETRHG
jgi:hypothetical protein